MKIIATHVNADFDGFAAMIGLLKLHPDARLVFPGAKEPVLRQFIQESGMEIPEISLKDVQQVQHLILVDASREDRLGPLADQLNRKPRPFVEIYDHHPLEQGTIRADLLHSTPYGATTTAVVLQLMKPENQTVQKLTSFEASVILAGIYEDTANFLSSGTTPEDFRAAQWLIEQGAEIAVVNRMLTHRIEPHQVAFFNALVANCETSKIEGVSIVISAFAWQAFVPEAAYLVHKLLDLEPIPVFFALIEMDRRVHVIGRSQLPDVNAGAILAQLGGGGHPMAASAVLKGKTLIEARETLLNALQKNLFSREKASDLMKRNIISIQPDKKVLDAAQQMNTYRINALAVREGERVTGTISRQIVDGAIFHGLQDRPVQDFMITEIPLIDPDTPASQVFDRMLSWRTRFVLVGRDADHVDGIITRMDLLRYHYEVGPGMLALRKGRHSENLHPMLAKRLPERVLSLLRDIGLSAEEQGMRAYLVGGMVRDLLLHRSNMDVDVVIEGDAIRFAEFYGQRHGCEVSQHRRFGTARIVFPDGFKVDLATARTESYHAPAALPQVYGGILRQDLYRRDFTINTLAIDLSEKSFGSLVDYFGGWDDLHQGVVRVLHSLSFVDDPTRTLRAIRFSTRFNFRISEDTERLLQSAVDSRVLDKLSGKRFWTELRHLLLEEHPISCIRQLQQFKLLSFIHPAIVLDAFLLHLLYEVETAIAWFRVNFPDEKCSAWLIYLMALLEKLNRNERHEIAQRFQLLAPIQEILRTYKSGTRDVYARLTTSGSRSSLYFSLKEYPLEVLLYSMARVDEQELKQKIAVFIRDLRSAHLEITGDDLIQMGMKPGPQIRELLREILKAHLDGVAPDRKTQLDFASARLNE